MDRLTKPIQDICTRHFDKTLPSNAPAEFREVMEATFMQGAIAFFMYVSMTEGRGLKEAGEELVEYIKLHKKEVTQ